MIYLGSKSPRRKELLTQMGYEFETLLMEVDESYESDIAPRDVPEFIAQKKADAMRSNLEEKDLLICADTIVLLENKILEKPKNEKEAFEMLTLLSGKKHEVLTGVVICSKNDSFAATETTEVYFKELSSEEINFYVEHYKPYDKAGSYGIQEWIGAVGIHRIKGSYNNVVGLPTHLVYDLVKKINSNI
jgi:septum formation protein